MDAHRSSYLRKVQIAELESIPQGRKVYVKQGSIYFPVPRDIIKKDLIKQEKIAISR